jgi:transcriptional regulator with XRE-family HTH domain
MYMESNKFIGGKVRSIRESRNLTVDEVSERAGVDKTQIERIENNMEIPSLAPLIKIARVLGVRLGTFLDDQTELGPVISRAQNSRSQNAIRFTNDSTIARKHMEYHSLSQDKAGRHMEPFLIDIEASGKDDFTPSSHEGEEFIYVLEGVVEIVYGKKKYTLEAGDSIYYDSIVAHHVHAFNDHTAKILGVVYTPF